MTETKPTPEQVRDYLDHRGVHCPVCGDHDISGGFIEVNDGFAWQEITCSACNYVWQDTYKLVGIADEQGKEIPPTPAPLPTTTNRFATKGQRTDAATGKVSRVEYQQMAF